jgi:hypothetical protein
MAQMTVETRREQVKDLRQQGLSFREIGRQLGISHELARRDARAVAGLTGLTAVPSGLGLRGQAFWDYAAATFEFDRHEQELLTQVCRLLDRADALCADIADHGVVLVTSQGNRKPNPALAEERQVSLTLGRLLAQLELPADDGSAGMVSPTTARARRAAQTRWRAHNVSKERWNRGPA